MMTTIILIIGIWAAVESLLAFFFPGRVRKIGRWISAEVGDYLDGQSDRGLRILAAIELFFGFWMLVLWWFTR